MATSEDGLAIKSGSGPTQGIRPVQMQSSDCFSVGVIDREREEALMPGMDRNLRRAALLNCSRVHYDPFA